jgi:hypothetical protein
LVHQASDVAKASEASVTGASASSTSKNNAAGRVQSGLGFPVALYGLALAFGALWV